MVFLFNLKLKTMSNGIKILIGIAVILLIGFFMVKGKYNTMVTQDEEVNQSWSQVENVYQRRADLIPNLVNTVKGYASHEKETLEGVVEARAKATSVNIDANDLNAQTMQQFTQAQQGLTSALSKLMVVVEKYPDLKANQNFLQLQAQLEGTENRIAVERQRYNKSVEVFNKNIRTFPNNIFAGMFGFEKKPYFEADKGAETVPEVNF
jgi:LemA protein